MEHKDSKTSYLEHIMRHRENEQLQLITEGKTEGKSAIGRKEKSWLWNKGASKLCRMVWID